MVKKYRTGIVVAGTIIGVLILGIYNAFQNNEFWNASITNILTILVALVFTYYMTQRTNNIRRKKDVVSKILDRLYVLIADPRMCKINSSKDVDFVKINIRTISNKISCLEQMARELQYEEEIRQMKEAFSSYEEFISDHINDIEYLKKSEKQLNNGIGLIDNKCDMILVKMNF